MKTIVSILFLCICLHTNLNAENNQKDITAIATSFNDDHFKLTLHNFPRNELVSISMQRKAIGEDKFRDVMKFQVTDRRFNVFDVSGKQLAVKEELLYQNLTYVLERKLLWNSRIRQASF